MDIQQIDHVVDGLSQLPSQWEDKPNVRGLLESWLRECNKLEQHLIDTRDGFNVNTAVGVQLDIIGGYFNEDRLGRSDADYRSAILAIIASGRGSGTPDQCMNLFGSLANTGNVEYWEHYPLSYAVLASGGDDDGINDSDRLKKASPAAVELAAVMFDPYGYVWKGYETYVVPDNLVDNLGNQIVTDVPDNIVVNVVVEGVGDGNFVSSFVDESEDGDTEFGYGINYGGNYGGSAQYYSWLAEASVPSNATVTNGGNNFVEWAEQSELDPLTGSTNKSKPPLPMSLSGLKRGQPFARQYFNWLMANIDSWFKLIHDRCPVGAIRMTTDNTKTISDYAAQYKKVDFTNTTWVSLGTDTFAGETVYVFKRTA